MSRSVHISVVRMVIVLAKWVL